MRIKKLLSYVAATAIAASAFAGLAVTASAAGEIYTISFNGTNVEKVNGHETTITDGQGEFFSWNTSKHNFNNKFNGATYDGISFTSGLKMEGATNVSFTTTQVSTVTIVQSTWSANTIKFDDEELAVDDAANGTSYRAYTISNVAAAEHSITRGGGESGIFYVRVQYIDPNAEYNISFAEMSNGTAKAYNSEDQEITKAKAGDSVTIKTTPDQDYKVRAITGVDATSSKENVFTFTMPANNVTITVPFVKDYIVTYSKGDDAAIEGTLPEGVTDTSVTIPKNYTLYKSGFTLTGWVDQDNGSYSLGNTYALTKDIDLKPVFTANTAAPAGSVVFDFRKQSGAPIMTKEQVQNNGFYVGQSTNGIDVKLDYDVTNGKLNNSSWDNCVQLNPGTTFTVPVTAGTTVTVGKGYNTNNTDGTLLWTVNGTEITGTGEDTYSSIIAAGNTATIVSQNGQYYYNETIKVTYPSITLDKNSVELVEGASATLTAAVVPSSATVTWSSSNMAVATVDNGVVAAVKEGTATITATTQYGQTATCEVTVSEIPSLKTVSEAKTWNTPDYATSTEVKYKGTDVYWAGNTLMGTANSSNTDAIAVNSTGIKVRTDSYLSIKPGVAGIIKVTTNNSDASFVINSKSYASGTEVAVSAGTVKISLSRDNRYITKIEYTPGVEINTTVNEKVYNGAVGEKPAKGFVAEAIDLSDYVNGTLYWKLTNGEDQTAKIEAANGNYTGSVEFGILIYDIPDDKTITKAELVIE